MAIWLTAPDDWIRARVLAESGFEDQPATARLLIEAFAERSVAFNQRLIRSATRYQQTVVDVSSPGSAEQLYREMLTRMDAGNHSR